MNNKKIGYLFSQMNNHNNIRHLRNIFKNDKLNIKYLFLENDKNIHSNFYLKENNINVSDLIFYNNNNFINIINSFDIILMCIAPDISWYINDKNFYNETIYNKINVKLIYIHHGLISMYNLDNLDVSSQKKYLYNSLKSKVDYINKYNITYITCCRNLYKIMKNLKVNNLIKINSLPQFDLNKMIFEKFSLYKDDIVICIGDSGKINYDLLKRIIIILKKYYNKKIIIKTKFSDKNEIKKKLNMFKDIIVYSYELFIGNLLNNFLSIIINGGTSFVDFLMFNNKTILINDYNSEHKYPFDKYPFDISKIFVLSDINKLDEIINIINNKPEYFDEKFQIEKEQIFNFHINNIINLFKDEIVNIIV